MWEQLYPPDKFPLAHEYLIRTLDDLGLLRIRQQDWAGAYPLLARALETRLRWVGASLSSASEAEALGFAAGLPESRDGLLSVAKRLPLAADLMYAQVWRSKSVISRIMQARQQRWGNGRSGRQGAGLALPGRAAGVGPARPDAERSGCQQGDSTPGTRADRSQGGTRTGVAEDPRVPAGAGDGPAAPHRPGRADQPHQVFVTSYVTSTSSKTRRIPARWD